MNVFDYTARSIDGVDRPLRDFAGQVLLIVNVASQCGFTPQYAGLEELQKHFAPQGFAVLGFPCDQFGHQEPGNEAEIKSFCQTKYDVTFPLFAKIKVNGSEAHPLYQHLKSAQPGVLGTEAIKWNFTKFLIGRDGAVRQRYAPNEAPALIADDIDAALQERRTNPP